MQNSVPMRRRTLLQLGIGASVLLTLVGSSLALLSPGLVAGRLTPRGRQLFAAVARAVLEGIVPPAGPESTQVLEAHLLRLDQTIAGFPSHLQDELSLLVALLTHAPGRYAPHDLLRVDAAELSTVHDSLTERRAARQRLLDHLIASAEIDVTACAYRHDWRRADKLSDHSALVAEFGVRAPEPR